MDLRTSYSKVRDDIKDCDILLYQGTHWMSRLIRKLTKSPYSHAGIVAWWGNRLMVLEATGKGVYPVTLSQNLSHYKGEVHLYTLKEEYDVSLQVRDRMLKFAQEELGKEYATWKLILFGWRILLAKDLDKKDVLRRANQLVCSHYVSQIYNSERRDLKKNRADRFTKPGDISESPILERLV